MRYKVWLRVLSTTIGFGREQRGAAAVEFVLVAGILIMTILFVMCVGLIEYIGQSIDYATQKAARQVMTGAIQKSLVTQAQFKSTLCSYLPAILNCSNVIVNLYTVTYGSEPSGYYTYTNGGNASGLFLPPLSNNYAQYSPGIQGSYEYLLVIYPVTFIPSAFASALGMTTYNGLPAYPVVVTAAFRNEQY